MRAKATTDAILKTLIKKNRPPKVRFLRSNFWGSVQRASGFLNEAYDFPLYTQTSKLAVFLSYL